METVDYMIMLRKSRKPGTTHFLMGNHCHAFAMFLGLFDDETIPGKSLGETCNGYLRDFELWKGKGCNDMHLQGRRYVRN